MRMPGLSKPKFFNFETGEEIKLERELSIEEISSMLEIDPEFKINSVILYPKIKMNWLAGAVFVHICVPNEDVRKKINLVLSGKKAAFYKLFYIISVTIDKKIDIKEKKIEVVFDYFRCNIPYDAKKLFDKFGERVLKNFQNFFLLQLLEDLEEYYHNWNVRSYSIQNLKYVTENYFTLL